MAIKTTTHGTLVYRSQDRLIERLHNVGRKGDVKFTVEYDEDTLNYTAIVLEGMLFGRRESVNVPKGAQGFLMELFDTAVEICEDEEGRPWRSDTPSPEDTA